MPFWRPEPLYSAIERLGNPLSSSSPRISSNASWRMNASIFFISLVLLGFALSRPCRAHRRDRGRGCPWCRSGHLRRRDELLWVAVHAVLDDIEAGVLVLG